MWDLIVSVPDHCLSFYSVHLNSDTSLIFIQPCKYMHRSNECYLNITEY